MDQCKGCKDASDCFDNQTFYSFNLVAQHCFCLSFNVIFDFNRRKIILLVFTIYIDMYICVYITKTSSQVEPQTNKDLEKHASHTTKLGPKFLQSKIINSNDYLISGLCGLFLPRMPFY